jgi:methionyl-tRNA formyltransferase
MRPPVVILTEAEHTVVLLSIAEMIDPTANVLFVTSRGELESFFASDRTFHRLVAFCTSVVVPGSILNRLAGPAYNFHPGPPTHPGLYAAPFAIYEEAKVFGVTLHEMLPSVDSGPIVGTMQFTIGEGTDVDWLRPRTRKAALKLFFHFWAKLANSAAPLRVLPVQWSGPPCTRRRFEAMLEVPVDIEAGELARRKRAFNKVDQARLYVQVHGQRFQIAE